MDEFKMRAAVVQNGAEWTMAIIKSKKTPEGKALVKRINEMIRNSL